MPGTGAIFNDPQFRLDYINDFRLSDTSPCIDAGSDGYDIGALPYTVRAQAPSAVAATPVGITEDCDVSWTNPTHDTDGVVLAALDAVNVYRNGELVATLSPASPGQVMSYTDTMPYSDWARYSISAVTGGVEGLRGNHAELWVGGDVTGILIWNMGHEKVNGEIVRDAILDRAYDGVIRLVERPDRYPLSTEVDAVFALLGVYGWNYVLGDADGQLLADYLDLGGNVYMEGSDTWYYDTPTPVHSYFSINPIADGTGDCAAVRGATGTFTEGMQFAYTGNNSYIDHLGPLDTAFVILSNESPAYDCGVAYDSGSYRTVGLSMDFAGLSDTSDTTQVALMDEILDFFGITGAGSNTFGVALDCTPDSGTLPFTTQMAAALENLTAQSRRVAARIDVVIGNGTPYSNWRGGSTVLSPGEIYNAVWNQNLPAVASLVGVNTFTLHGEDVTPPPYNQPPYLPSGDVDSDACTVTCLQP